MGAAALAESPPRDGQAAQGHQGLPGAPLALDRGTDLGWLGRYRRLSKDYEYLPQTSETMIRVAMIHLMVRRLARLTCF
jgi:transposase